VREIMHTLPPAAQEAIRDDLEGQRREGVNHRDLSVDTTPFGALGSAR
jgi:hypothetical protein